MNNTDVKAFLEQMNSDLKEKSPSVFSQKTYTDEPIIRTAAQMKNYEPPEYREMRRISYYAYEKGWSTEHIFYEQAKFMADFEDDYEFTGSFSSYFPTYTAMNPAQQRGYFSWWTRVRKGDVRPSSTSFAFVYMYELINLIGVKSAEEAFFRLHSFYKAYLPFAPELSRYAEEWLADTVAFYGLDISLFNAYFDFDFEEKLAVLQNCGNADDKTLFTALNALSQYKITDSEFFREYPRETSFALCAAFREMSEKYNKSHKSGFDESLFGRICALPHTVFGTAVFYDRTRVPDRTVKFNENYVYTFLNGQCMLRRCYGGRTNSSVLAKYIKYTESVLRTEFGFYKPLNAESPSKPFVKTAQKAAAEAVKEHERRKRAEELRYVDTSLLDSIIVSAEKTRDKLLTDEELETAETPQPDNAPANAPAAENEAEKTEETNPLPLDDAELGFIRLLLNGGDISAYLKERGLKCSLVCDRVNEKLYDMFCDNVIDFDGDTPVLIDDYKEDLAEYLPEHQE